MSLLPLVNSHILMGLFGKPFFCLILAGAGQNFCDITTLEKGCPTAPKPQPLVYHIIAVFTAIYAWHFFAILVDSLGSALAEFPNLRLTQNS